MDTAHISVQISHFYLSWGRRYRELRFDEKTDDFCPKALSDSGFWAAAEADRQRHLEKIGLSMKELNVMLKKLQLGFTWSVSFHACINKHCNHVGSNTKVI